MSDIAIVGNIECFDLALDGADLLADDGLDTAVILSLFCDARASDDDVGYDAGTDPRGWWGDYDPAVPNDQTGSKLWLLARSKQLQSVINAAQNYAAAALAWLVTDGIAAAVNVAASIPQAGTLALDVQILRPAPDAPFNRQYQYVWSAYA